MVSALPPGAPSQGRERPLAGMNGSSPSRDGIGIVAASMEVRKLSNASLNVSFECHTIFRALPVISRPSLSGQRVRHSGSVRRTRWPREFWRVGCWDKWRGQWQAPFTSAPPSVCRAQVKMLSTRRLTNDDTSPSDTSGAPLPSYTKLPPKLPSYPDNLVT